MPWNQVLSKFKHGLLHSGSKKGSLVQNRKQAIAIMLSEKKKADSGDSEYKALTTKRISPSVPAFNKLMSNASGKKRSLMTKKRVNG